MAVILIVMPLVWHIKLGILLMLCVSVVIAVAKYALLLTPGAIVALSINQQNELQIWRKDGICLEGLCVCSETLVTPYLCLIRLQHKNAPFIRRVFKISIVLFSDTADADNLRRLRTWLRWGIKPI